MTPNDVIRCVCVCVPLYHCNCTFFLCHLSLSLSLSFTHSLTHSITHSFTHSLTNSLCIYLFVSLCMHLVCSITRGKYFGGPKKTWRTIVRAAFLVLSISSSFSFSLSSINLLTKRKNSTSGFFVAQDNAIPWEEYSEGWGEVVLGVGWGRGS